MNRRLRTWWGRIKTYIVVVTLNIILVTSIIIVGLATNPQRANTIGFSQSASISLISLAAGFFAAMIAGAIYFLIQRQQTQSIEPDKHPQKEVALRLSQQEHELEKQRADLENQQQILTWQMEATVLAEEDPRLAIVVAYQGVEVELQRVVNRLYPTDIPEEIDKQRFNVLHNLSLLEKHIGSENLGTIKQMYDLRNRIIHGEVKPEEVSGDRAAEYVQQAISMTRIISSLEEYERSSS